MHAAYLCHANMILPYLCLVQMHKLNDPRFCLFVQNFKL